MGCLGGRVSVGLWQSLLGGAMPFSDGFWRWDKSSLPVPGLCSFPQGPPPVGAYFRNCPAPSRAQDTPTPTPTTPTACGASGWGTRTAESSSSLRMWSESGWALAVGLGVASSPLWGLGSLCPSTGARWERGRVAGPAARAACGADRCSSPSRLEGSSCSYDAIEVFDGGSPQSWRLGLVCSNNHRVFISSGPQLTVLFRSDGSVTKRGFHAYYSSFLAFKSTTGKTRAVLYSLPGQKLKLNHKELLVAPNSLWASRPSDLTERHPGSRAFFRIGWP